MPSPRPPRGFTLVELLVVVAIIVVLLALLVPALDKAIYQAELTKCGANQGGVATALNIYAASHKRSYPHRPGVGQFAMSTWQVSGAGVSVQWLASLKGYLAVNKQFNDPLCKAIEIEKSATTSGVFTPYSYYAGGRFSQKHSNYQKGMLKIGDRLEYHLDANDAPYPTGPRKYDLLFGDFAYTAIARNVIEGSHPDKAGLMHPQWGQDIDNYYEATSPYYAQNNITESFWRSNIGSIRSVIDLNFARSDGSVQRVNDVEFEGDDRMDWVPYHWDNQYKRRVQVPRSN